MTLECYRAHRAGVRTVHVERWMRRSGDHEINERRPAGFEGALERGREFRRRRDALTVAIAGTRDGGMIDRAEVCGI